MRTNTARFHGAFPALPTPFDRHGMVSEQTLRSLVRDLILQGVTGFYVNGSTAESMLLSPDERRYALEAVMSEAKGEAVVIAHVGALSTKDTVALAEHAASLGVDAVSAVPPIYFKYSFAEIKRFYAALAEVGLPVLLYNIPALTGISLTAEQFAELLSDQRMLGIKHTCTDYFLLERLRALFPDAVLYNGYDETFLAGQVMGADGGIGSTYNVMPAKFHAIMQAVEQGDIPAAKAFQRSVNRVIEAMLPSGVIPSLKAVLTAQGYPFGAAREPFSPLTKAQKEHLLTVCQQEGLL